MVQVRYSEPAGDLIPVADRSAPFSAGGAAAGGPALRILRALVVPLVGLACLLALAGCSSLSGTGDKGYITGEGVPTEVKAVDRGAPVELTGTDLDGDDVDLADLRGKPVVVNVWWSECPPCRVEQPDLNEAAAELGDSVAFLGLNIRDSGRGEGAGLRPQLRGALPLDLRPRRPRRCCPSPARSTRAPSRARWCSTRRAASPRRSRAGSRRTQTLLSLVEAVTGE